MTYPSMWQEFGRIISKRKLFVSYHHKHDQVYYGSFVQHFSTNYDLIEDNSLDRLIDSDNSEYVMRRIREDYIEGSSCTIVLCGPESRWRKFIDWEIKATLDKEHGLISILLPNNPRNSQGQWHKPDRLQDNLDSGYALWTTWESLGSNVEQLTNLVEAANNRPKAFIRNSRAVRVRNGT